MTLTDTGPLVALLDDDDASHEACFATASRLSPGPLLTTWSCYSEAMYLLGNSGGYHYQAEFWKLQGSGRLVLYDLLSIDLERMAHLMEKYQDTPMDLADASLVAVAESLSLRRIFTIDKDFYIYRLSDGSMLEIIR